MYTETKLSDLEKCFADDGIDVIAVLKAAGVTPRKTDLADVGEWRYATHEAMPPLLEVLDSREREEIDAIKEDLSAKVRAAYESYERRTCRMV